jgi:hypothetical protein
VIPLCTVNNFCSIKELILTLCILFSLLIFTLLLILLHILVSQNILLIYILLHRSLKHLLKTFNCYHLLIFLLSPLLCLPDYILTHKYIPILLLHLWLLFEVELTEKFVILFLNRFLCDRLLGWWNILFLIKERVFDAWAIRVLGLIE